ncbi:hypothetical protein M8J77_002967 [Diaphorina citri]|nr:hypothetical protein M8J77_002967 [Diaphorina citri]
MDGTPKFKALRSRMNDNNSCLSLDLTSEFVWDFALRLDTQVKKCLETLDSQDIKNLVPIIVGVLQSLDQNITDLIECQKKRDSLQEKTKNQSNLIKQLKQDLEIERKAHQETILESDTQIRELTNEHHSAEADVKRMKQKIEQDKNDIDCMSLNIIKMSKETNKVALENTKLKESIDSLKEQLSDLEAKLKENPRNHTPDLPNVIPTTSTMENKATRPGPQFQCRTVHVLGDSNTRGMGSIMKQYVCNNLKVLTSCIPGGGLCQLPDAFINEPLPGDLIILHAGTNDICCTKWDQIKQHLGSFFSRYHGCDFLIFTVPPRYDCPYLNKHINKFNTLLKYFVPSYNNVQLQYINRIISRKHMKTDGIHYNSQGQNKLARKIAGMIKQDPAQPLSPHRSSPLRIHPIPVQATSSAPVSPGSSSQTCSTPTSPRITGNAPANIEENGVPLVDEDESFF